MHVTWKDIVISRALRWGGDRSVFFATRLLSNSLALLQFKGARKGDFVATAGDGGLLFLNGLRVARRGRRPLGSGRAVWVG